MFGSSDADDASSSGTSSSESEKEEAKAPVSRKRRRARDSSDEEDMGKVTVVQTKRTRRQSPVAKESVEEAKKQRKSTRKQSTPVEDEERTTPRSKRRRLVKRPSTPVEEIKEQTPPRSKHRRIAARRPSTLEEGDDEDSEENQQEQGDESGVDSEEGNEEKDELKEDLAFLRSSPPPDRGRLRSTHDKPKNERQKALEALKKRRAGTQEPSSDRATPGRSRRIVVESSSESELEVIKEEPDSDREAIDDVEDDDSDDSQDGSDGSDGEQQHTNVLDMFQEDDNDANFIDDDPDALIGAPDGDEPEPELPLEFSSLSRAKPKELFKYAVEWMVMKKIHPAFDSKNGIYNLTFRKLDDEVNGLANSKFTSSAWTSDFSRAIRARPDLMVMEISRGLRDIGDSHCEACNRRNHPATWELMMQGMPYDKDTLEPVENDSDSDDSSSEISASDAGDGEKPVYDITGQRLPSESHRFTLGSTCKANAQVAHTLHHWRYHLYSWVKDYLAREGHVTAEMLVKREKWSDRKRNKAAHKIVDAMESGGEIRKLYLLYRDQVKFAVEAVNDYQKGWGRR
ncbi:hypothetical protein P153DRAFT_297540 [Dothidotthia symphoricarpi CBS 119687]|uniref:DUF4211 domain-containing protein n=1 Tax=Dothidotthia symphoricarpi CBS 119687 TaxID=1392245 RepID=A0A6A6A6X0_9PLEO|nr:uncharacterized protein P153DRAFT_297540 [Dothidotthia symphoricarpi CBS 119687]KAF2126371.1 hypothetical protein P153DRAFT_297540 [Dothidotthia symphoricarpi CBS 119687]